MSLKKIRASHSAGNLDSDQAKKPWDERSVQPRVDESFELFVDTPDIEKAERFIHEQRKAGRNGTPGVSHGGADLFLGEDADSVRMHVYTGAKINRPGEIDQSGIVFSKHRFGSSIGHAFTPDDLNLIHEAMKASGLPSHASALSPKKLSAQLEAATYNGERYAGEHATYKDRPVSYEGHVEALKHSLTQLPHHIRDAKRSMIHRVKEGGAER